jgi:hypothetical protein
LIDAEPVLPGRARTIARALLLDATVADDGDQTRAAVRSDDTKRRGDASVSAPMPEGPASPQPSASKAFVHDVNEGADARRR